MSIIYKKHIYFTANGSPSIGGSSEHPTATKTADYVVQDSDTTRVFLVDTTAAAVAVTLPDAVDNSGKEFTIKRIAGANNVTINTTDAQTIDGGATSSLTALYESVCVKSDGANWWII